MPTAAQLLARQAFDIDAAMAQLPSPSKPKDAVTTSTGQAGTRLHASHVATISDDLLEDFARNTLGAIRIREAYPHVLRVVLGNQAVAERQGHILEMNQRVEGLPRQVLRTIIVQMKAAGITSTVSVNLGKGRRQDVQCFEGQCQAETSLGSSARPYPQGHAPGISDTDVPY